MPTGRKPPTQTQTQLCSMSNIATENRPGSRYVMKAPSPVQPTLHPLFTITDPSGLTKEFPRGLLCICMYMYVYMHAMYRVSPLMCLGKYRWIIRDAYAENYLCPRYILTLDPWYLFIASPTTITSMTMNLGDLRPEHPFEKKQVSK